MFSIRGAVVALSVVGLWACGPNEVGLDADGNVELPEDFHELSQVEAELSAGDVRNFFTNFFKSQKGATTVAIPSIGYGAPMWGATVNTNKGSWDAFSDQRYVAAKNPRGILIYPAGYKYRRGACTCKSGKKMTCDIEKPTSSHEACNRAVKCACQKCWDVKDGPPRADGCQ